CARRGVITTVVATWFAMDYW
nr:immunoglobulin heavy chain junction region [Mus musculus]